MSSGGARRRWDPVRFFPGQSRAFSFLYGNKDNPTFIESFNKPSEVMGLIRGLLAHDAN